MTTSSPRHSVNAYLAGAREQLRSAGIAPGEIALDARLLAQHVLGWDAARLLTAGNEPAPEGFADAFRSVVARRALREPLAYITRTKEFWGLPFEVTADVLVPRPETELLVESLLDALPGDEPRLFADVCTGSGCVAVAVARERSRSRLVATDISPGALAVATRNAALHGVAERVRTVHADLLSGVDGPFDAIVANPPYVPQRDRDSLQPEVREFEPALALFAGDAGLDAIQRLVPQAAAQLTPGGWLLFEFGLGQEGAIAGLLSATPALTMERIAPDLQGIPRVAIARRR